MRGLKRVLALRKPMCLSLRTKLIVSFVVVVLMSGLVATFVGIHLIGRRIVEQAQNNVKMDLNSAREIYQDKLEDSENLLNYTVLRDSIKNALAGHDRETLGELLTDVREKADVDILTITDRDGNVVTRSRSTGIYGDDQSADLIVQTALSTGEIVSGTTVMSREELLKEGEDLARRARLVIIPTPQAKPKPQQEHTWGLVLKSAAPVLDDDGALLGVLYAGELLNRDYEVVDKVKDILYRGEKYKGKDIGTATIFEGDLRVSTNVVNDDGSRAIGTCVSEAVYDQVLLKGESWIARAFVVNDWYISAYEPIKDIAGNIVGILYVGLLEQKFTDMERETTLSFLGVTLAGMVLALAVSYILADNITKPVRRLVAASEQIASGNLAYRVRLDSRDEIGELGKMFDRMAASLKERDEQLKAYTERQLLRSERLASLGRLAAGVAHEINNPLTGVLTFGHLLLRKYSKGQGDGADKEALETIVNETARCKRIVRGLLDFARETELQEATADINDILQEALRLTENQALVNNVDIIREFDEDLPEIMVDKGQIQQVFVNILVNAIDAMPDGGTLCVSSTLTEDGRFIAVRFGDTGCGIARENIGRVFDPFFTTKDASKGTGLGLAVSYGIVTRHNGSIEVESEVGEGSTFTVRLPLEERN
jgi:two-component system NtrC family sensor kinase